MDENLPTRFFPNELIEEMHRRDDIEMRETELFFDDENQSLEKKLLEIREVFRYMNLIFSPTSKHFYESNTLSGAKEKLYKFLKIAIENQNDDEYGESFKEFIPLIRERIFALEDRINELRRSKLSMIQENPPTLQASFEKKKENPKEYELEKNHQTKESLGSKDSS